jgi:deoxyribonucleoside regulator
MNDKSNIRATLSEVARLYYKDQLSQQKIADQLGVSRSLIALYLKKALDQGIVRIEIIDPQDVYEELAYAIQSRTDLQHVSIVPGSHNAPALTRRSLGGAVARYLEDQLQHGDIVGFGWGRTIMEVANLLAPSKPLNIEALPLLGESAYTGAYSQSNQIIMQIARSFEGQPHFLLAPIFVGSRELRDLFLKDDSARQVPDYWNRLSYAVVGIGSLPVTSGQVLYIGETEAKIVVERGAVGDVCVHYFDIDGQFVATEIDERLIGVSAEQLKKAHCVIAVAGGTEKTKAVVGALRSGLLTHLFLDEELARNVLAELEEDASG